MTKTMSTLLIASVAALAFANPAAAAEPAVPKASAALCQEQLVDALKMQALADTVMHRNPFDNADAARVTAAATLGILNLMVADRLVCPKALPNDTAPASQQCAAARHDYTPHAASGPQIRHRVEAPHQPNRRPHDRS